MPARTNEFQQLIFLIQKQLGQDAIITESKFLIDSRTGNKVEVDVVVEFEKNEIPIVIGFECTASKRPATIEWVREMIGKHQALNIDKSVLVSKTGFTKDAQRTADSEKIVTLSLEEAENIDWLSSIENYRDLTLGSYELNIESWKIQYGPGKSGQIEGKVTENSFVCLDGDQEKWLSIKDYLSGVMRDRENGGKILRELINLPKSKRKKGPSFNLKWLMKSQTLLKDDLGNIYKALGFEINVVCKIKETKLALEPVKIGDKNLAYGTAENIFEKNAGHKQKVIVTILEENGKPKDSALLIPASKNKESKTFISSFKKP